MDKITLKGGPFDGSTQFIEQGTRKIVLDTLDHAQAIYERNPLEAEDAHFNPQAGTDLSNLYGVTTEIRFLRRRCTILASVLERSMNDRSDVTRSQLDQMKDWHDQLSEGFNKYYVLRREEIAKAER